MNATCWIWPTILGLLMSGCPMIGCAVDKEKMDNTIALATAGSALAEKHGVEVDVKLDSDGGGFDFNQQYRFTLGRLQAQFKTNPLAPVLFRQMESQQAVTMAIIATQATANKDMQLALSELSAQTKALVAAIEVQRLPPDSKSTGSADAPGAAAGAALGKQPAVPGMTAPPPNGGLKGPSPAGG